MPSTLPMRSAAVEPWQPAVTHATDQRSLAASRDGADIVRLALILMTSLFLAGCGEPLVTIPGGTLAGEVAAPPTDWAALADIETIQVEFRPSDPYSINIWGVGIGRDLYIATGADGTKWTEMIAADPAVRVRVGSTLYALTAVAVEDAAEHGRVAEAYGRKYELEGDDNWVATGLVFRFDRR
jgi:hypothetical protein